MWKIVILAALLVVVHGASLDEIYGSYFAVMFFPTSAYVPYCIRYAFTKDPRNIQCTCADGKNTTMVDLRIVEASNPDGPKPTYQDPGVSSSGPLLAVDTVEEVNAFLNVSCNCAGKELPSRSVVRKVNKNYIILYGIDYGMSYYNDIEKNSAQLMAKKLPGNVELIEDLKRIEELRHRNGAALCSKEVYDEFNSRL